MEKWECPKCKNGEYEKDQFQAIGITPNLSVKFAKNVKNAII